MCSVDPHQLLLLVFVLLSIFVCCSSDSNHTHGRNQRVVHHLGEDGSVRRSLQLISATTCNISVYQEWLQEQYFGSLASDSNFWRYQTQPQIVLTNEMAMELALRGCKRLFDLLYYWKAGRMGPITIQDSYKIMCRPYCLENDKIHQEAMRITGCSCLELSTPPTQMSYTQEGDWCLHNSAQLLCNKIGYCGIWNCRIDDFMCPRYEWNKKFVPYKGPGTCVRGAASKLYSGVGVLQVVATSLVAFILYSWM